MKKAILSFALLLSALDIMAQAYKFDTEEGDRSINFYIKEWIELSTSSPDIRFGVIESYAKNSAPILTFSLYKESDKNLAVTKELIDLELSIPDDAEYKNVTINLHLSNGDILRCTNKGTIKSSHSPFLEYGLDIGIGRSSFYTHSLFLVSSRFPKEVGTGENVRVICQQLRTYDIVKIEVDGVSFDVRGLRSAATYDAMFNALAQKTGKGHLYKYITVR